MCSGQERPQFLGDPHWPNQQINWSLKKRRFISFDPMSEEQEHPASYEASRSSFPAQQRQKDDSRKNQRDSDPVQQFVPS